MDIHTWLCIHCMHDHTSRRHHGQRPTGHPSSTRSRGSRRPPARVPAPWGRHRSQGEHVRDRSLCPRSCGQAPRGVACRADPRAGGRDAVTMTSAGASGESPRRWLPAIFVLSVPAAAGAVLSYASLYEYARPTFGPVLAAGVPLLVDALVLGASLAYVTGARVGRGRAGWRMIAHLGVAGTILLNALAAERLEDVALHVTAPIVWSLLVEMTAREVVGEYRATHERPTDRIPLSLWLTAPVESARTFLLMRRLDERSAVRARVLVGAHAAAREALVLTLPGWFARRARRVLRRQLRSGTLRPSVLMTAIGWGEASRVVQVSTADALRAALRDAALSEDDDAHEAAPGRARTTEVPELPELPASAAVSVDLAELDVVELD